MNISIFANNLPDLQVQSQIVSRINYICTLNNTLKDKIFIYAIINDYKRACKVVMECCSFFRIDLCPVSNHTFCAFASSYKSVIFLLVNSNPESRKNEKYMALKGAHY